MANLGEVVVQIRAEMAQFKRAFKAAGLQVRIFAMQSALSLRSLGSVIKRFALTAGRHLYHSFTRTLRRSLLAITAFTAASIKAFADLEKQMAQVNTMLDDTTEHLLPRFTQEVQSMAIQFGQSTQIMADALYNTLSASVAASKAIGFVGTAARTAVAGLTDTATATKALASVMNSYQMQAEDAEKISDILFATVKKGQITFAQLAPNIGKVAAIAATAGMELETLGAAIATITRGGLPAELTMTSMRSIIKSFVNPMAEAKVAAEELGVELSSAMLQGENFFKTLAKLSAATPEQLVQLFPEMRSMAGGAIALRDALGAFEDWTLALNSQGLMMEAYGKQVETVAFQWGRFTEAIKAVSRAFGAGFKDEMLGFFKDSSDWVDENAEKIKMWGKIAAAQILFVKDALQGLWDLWREEPAGAYQAIWDSLIVVIKTAARLAIGLAVQIGQGIWKGVKSGVFGDIFGDVDLEARGIYRQMGGKFGGEKVHDVPGRWDYDKKGPGGMQVTRSFTGPALDQEKWAEAQRKASANLMGKWIDDQLVATQAMLEGVKGKMVAELGDGGPLAGILDQANATRMDRMREASEDFFGHMMEDQYRFQKEAIALADEWLQPDVLYPIDKVIPAAKKAATAMEQIWWGTADSIASAMGNAFTDIATSAKTMTEALTDMLNQIHRAISQEVFRRLLMGPIMGMMNLPTPQLAPVSRPGEFQETGGNFARGGLVGRGLGRVLHAASGMLVPQGTDTVPIMATPGEEVIEKPIVDYIKRTQAQPPAMTINVNSVTGRDAYAFLNDNKRTIASMMQSAMSGNHPLRRDR